jgi:hypothetical protein
VALRGHLQDLIIQNILDRAETPAVYHAVDHLPGEDGCAMDPGKVVAKFLFVGGLFRHWHIPDRLRLRRRNS